MAIADQNWYSIIYLHEKQIRKIKVSSVYTSLYLRHCKKCYTLLHTASDLQNPVQNPEDLTTTALFQTSLSPQIQLKMTIKNDTTKTNDIHYLLQ